MSVCGGYRGYVVVVEGMWWLLYVYAVIIGMLRLLLVCGGYIGMWRLYRYVAVICPICTSRAAQGS